MTLGNSGKLFEDPFLPECLGYSNVTLILSQDVIWIEGLATSFKSSKYLTMRNAK
jgi:hypothetical protein